MNKGCKILIGLAHGEFLHAVLHQGQRIAERASVIQTPGQQSLEAVGKRLVFRFMLMHDHGTAELCCAGGIGILMSICCLGERHQHRRCAADR